MPSTQDIDIGKAARRISGHIVFGRLKELKDYLRDLDERYQDDTLVQSILDNPDPVGNTPLHMSVLYDTADERSEFQRNFVTMTALLMSYGAREDIENKFGHTAESFVKSDLMRQVIAHYKEVREQHPGKTPLRVAREAHAREVARLRQLTYDDKENSVY